MVVSMYAVCIGVLNDKLHHIRIADNLVFSGGMTEMAVCGTDVVFDVEEVNASTLRDARLCPTCRAVLETILVS